MLQAVGEVDGATSGRRIFDRLRMGTRAKLAGSADHQPPATSIPATHQKGGGKGDTKLIDLLSPIEALGHDRNLLWLVAERIVKSESLAVVIPDHQFDLRCAT